MANDDRETFLPRAAVAGQIVPRCVCGLAEENRNIRKQLDKALAENARLRERLKNAAARVKRGPFEIHG